MVVVFVMRKYITRVVLALLSSIIASFIILPLIKREPLAMISIPILIIGAILVGIALSIVEEQRK